MRWEYQIGAILLACIIVLALGILWYNVLIPFAISPIHFFGFIILAVLGYAMISIEIMRGQSPSFSSNAIYDSINDKEIRVIPWSNDLIADKKKPMMMAFVPLGGINFWGINPRSPSNKPFIIQPWNDLGKIGDCYRSKTNLIPHSFEQLPPDIRDFALKTYGNRILKCPMILFGLTSYEDGSANTHNERIWFARRKDNEQVSKMENLLDWANKELERKGRSKERVVFAERMGTGSEE